MAFTLNPTKSKAWLLLQEQKQTISQKTLNDLFSQNVNRQKDFTLDVDHLSYDFSKNYIDTKTLELLTQFAEEMELKEAIDSLFNGKKINTTEDRAVLHTVLRAFRSTDITIDDKLVFNQVQEARQKLKLFCDQVIDAKWLGSTGKPIKNIVNIGIGGSDLGPQMAIEALGFYKNHLKTYFISNVDGDETHRILKKLEPERTIFIIVSKTFTTIETLTNAKTCKEWLLNYIPQEGIKKHFIAVSSNLKGVVDFGIDKDNIFPMWSWVGGRFSMWSSVGMSIALSIGFEHFEQFLRGANYIDHHFKKTPFDKNIPVIMGLLSVWYINFFETKAQVILPYAEALNKLPSYLQQLCMESNGKSVDRLGAKVDYSTGAVIFGAAGSNAQHSFMQHIHQGTQLIPADFIGFSEPLFGNKTHHNILLANLKAQSKALSEGKDKSQVHLSMKLEGKTQDINRLLPYKTFEGNRVSNTFLFDELTPYTLGMLVALYEHKVFVEGVLWNINSFDQFGVELGKEIAKKYS